MGVWWQLAMGIGALWLVLRFVLSRFGRPEAAESKGRQPGHPLAGVPAPQKRGPRNRSGAVALAEPDEEDGQRSYPPREL
jgi:hypothetical protein